MDWTTIQSVSQVESKCIYSLNRTCDLFTKLNVPVDLDNWTSDNSNSPPTRTVYRFPSDLSYLGSLVFDFLSCQLKREKDFKENHAKMELSV